MMKRQYPHEAVRHFPKALICTAILSTPVQAIEFSIGEIEGSFDSQLSIGASWRVEDANPALISPGNGGTNPNNGPNNDDGNLNFAEGETYSKIFKGIHDLELRYQNYGAFVRGKYWYDFELEDEKRPHGHSANGFASNEPLSDDGFNDFAQFSGAEILDAFVYGEFELGEMPLDLRLGRQVVSWGESTFIRGGINVINPVDVAAFRRPGAEIKEGLLPVNMAYANLGLTENLNIEGFYQLEFEQTVLDGCGTLYALNDFASEGCNQINISQLADATALAGGYTVARNADGVREADDDGQFGVALRYLSEELNDTEFGFYFINYHNRLPSLAGVKAGAGNPVPFVPGDPFGANPTYFSTYVEDIQLYGLSAASNVGEWAVSGEISHRKDVPININGPTFVQAMLTGGALPSNPVSSTVAAAGAGDVINAYRLYDMSQIQATGIRTFSNVLGSSNLTFIAEAGWTHVHGLHESIPHERAGTYGTGVASDDGFITSNSWGYRLRAKADYNDVFASINLRPGIAFAHDVKGFGPQASGGFQEGRKALGLSLTADYLNRYSANLSYTRFFGGDFNITEDKDFISASFSVSF
ncbi:DUF1302 domain-containing protein [Pontibacterium sp.]|uniref:DUF1302 domain-containing protein n=1 Tax=Pontibacterium sp. TaxID=2036026 RepID=UPI0035197FD0